MKVRWRNTGMIALALLVCGCVLAALAGPAQSLRIRTQALRQTLNQLPSDSKTVQVTAALGNFNAAIQQTGGSGVDSGTMSATRQDLRGDLAATPLPLTRPVLASSDWSALTVKPHDLLAYPPRAKLDLPPEMDPISLDTLSRDVRVTAGTLTAPSGLANGTLAVSVTAPVASLFGLRPGSRIALAGKITLLVTGIVQPRDAGSSFWDQEPSAAAPAVGTQPSGSGSSPPLYYYDASPLVDPGQFSELLRAYDGPEQFTATWVFPIDTSHLTADRVGVIQSDLNRAVTVEPVLQSSGVDAATAGLAVSTSLLNPLSAFTTAQQSVLAVLLLMFVSLILVGASVIVLAARMIVAGRDEELTMLRARGAANWQVAWLMLRSSATAAIPAAVAAVLISRAVSGAVWLGWPLAAFTGVVALAGPPLVALWQYRRPAPPRNRARVTGADPRTRRWSTRALRRLVTEVAACAAAAGGLVVLHGQGVQPGGTNWYLTITPILVAIPAVVVILRLYPLVIRLLLRLAARRAGPTSYLALSGSARTSLAAVGPAFALVLALALATFAGMVSQAVDRGQVAQSWQVSGADAVVNKDVSPKPISPAAQHAIAAVPGVTATAAVWHDQWSMPGNAQPIEVAVVDRATYLALTRQTPFPALDAADLSVSDGVNGAVVSPAAAALLGTGTVTLSPAQQAGSARIKVTRVVASSPAVVDAGPVWAIIAMPPGIAGLPGYERPAMDQLLLTGAVNRTALAGVLRQWLPGSSTYYRADRFAALHDSPLSHGAQQLMLLIVVAAAGLGLVNLVLGLALGAADREVTIARLAVMGYTAENRLVIAETMPAVLAATVAGLCCALVLPALVGSALDLSVFTGSGAAVRLSPGLSALGAPAGVLLVLALITLIAQTRLGRRRGFTGLLRAT